MKELMLEILTYEPYGTLVSGEEDYIREILSGNYDQPKSILHDLFLGFYDYVQNGDFKNIGWLQQWISTYSPKSGRFYYPLMLKKIRDYRDKSTIPKI